MALKPSLGSIKLNFIYWINEMSNGPIYHYCFGYFFVVVIAHNQQWARNHPKIIIGSELKVTIMKKDTTNEHCVSNGPINDPRNMIEEKVHLWRWYF